MCVCVLSLEVSVCGLCVFVALCLCRWLCVSFMSCPGVAGEVVLCFKRPRTVANRVRVGVAVYSCEAVSVSCLVVAP